jgi:hypothetical protein
VTCICCARFATSSLALTMIKHPMPFFAVSLVDVQKKAQITPTLGSPPPGRRLSPGLLRAGFERARFDHDFFDACPCSFEECRLIGECQPEIIDELRFADGAYVVEDCFYTSIGCDFFVSPELFGGHRKPFKSDASMSRASLFTGKRTCARRSMAQDPLTAMN